MACRSMKGSSGATWTAWSRTRGLPRSRRRSRRGGGVGAPPPARAGAAVDGCSGSLRFVALSLILADERRIVWSLSHPSGWIRQRNEPRTTNADSRKARMNIFLWILQVLLALHTMMGAAWKLSNSEQAVPSLSAIPHGIWLLLIVVELLCAAALVVPGLSKRLGGLVPLGALGVAAEMLLFCGV